MTVCQDCRHWWIVRGRCVERLAGMVIGPRGE